jgi:hypothetical protein
MAWGRSKHVELLTAEEHFSKLTVDDLRPLATLLGGEVPKRKTELVPLLVRAMTNAKRVREFFDRLDTMSQNAIRMATFDPNGQLDETKFQARYSTKPRFNTADTSTPRYLSYAERKNIKPTLLQLFFPRYRQLPTDTQALLREFVTEPEAFAITTLDTIPTHHKIHSHSWSSGKKVANEWEEPLRVREMAHEAEADLISVLRLIEAGKVRVTDKKLIPTEATRQAIAPILTNGDFYQPDEAEEGKWDPAFDLSIRAFGWPLLVQAGGLAEKSGDALKLSTAGRSALTAKPADTLRKLWTKWLKTRQFDEFARIDVIKGQSVANFSSVANRRAVLLDALSRCPVGRWLSVNDFFRLIRANGQPFTIVSDIWELYLAEKEYGSLGYENGQAWEQLQGRYTLAFLFEYAATLGLIDVAYLPPQGVRHDYRDRWGTDDYSCLSRYDGLLYAKVNPLGAWILGTNDEYRPTAPTPMERFRVLANQDIVIVGTLPAADRLVLDRFAEPSSEGVWKLSASKILDAVEKGGTVDEVEQFLRSRCVGELPDTVAQSLNDLRSKAARLIDAGACRLLECADEFVAAELASDRQLKGKCLRTGDRFLVIREADLAAVQKVVRKLGYVWPVQRD